MRADLTATCTALRAGLASASQEIDASIEIARSSACEHVFLQAHFDQARLTAGRPASAALPLGGLAVSVKDLFDIAGDTTTAGSVVLADAPSATADCPAVARLRASGGAILGRTNMTEFAFSGVGTNPHHGTPVNPADPKTSRIPGGSTSGGAVSVATGAAFVALGSDTGGSIRIPAALCGVVGFKNTARLTPREGALPLSTTLDTVCAMTRSVRDAILVHEILADRLVARANVSLRAYRLAVARSSMLDGMDATVARAFERTVKALRDAGAVVEEIDLAEIRDLGALQSTGGFTAPESYAWHRALFERESDRYDPRVRVRIQRGTSMLAYEYLELVRARSEWSARVERALRGFDGVLSPTVPIVAPPIAQVAPADGRDPLADAARDEEFFRVNALLLRNTSVVNMLDGCAISIPCHVPGELPSGLMIWQSAMRDDTVLNIALQAEAVLAGTTGNP